MYWPEPGIKRHPEKRWRKPDRIFFGFGACHILGGVFLRTPPVPGFHAERIIPATGFPGSHIFATDGVVSFDFHGYASHRRLLAHYFAGWRKRYPGWEAKVEPVTFDLLDTADLNRHKHLGPDQYFGDPIARAEAFLARIDHKGAYDRARATCIPAPAGDVQISTDRPTQRITDP